LLKKKKGEMKSNRLVGYGKRIVLEKERNIYTLSTTIPILRKPLAADNTKSSRGTPLKTTLKELR